MIEPPDLPPPAPAAPIPGPPEAPGPYATVCHACGRSVDARAQACPHCGAWRLAPGAGTQIPAYGEGKDRVLAIVLALLLGGLGIHKFYLGRIGLGILYLVFSWTGIPGLIAWIEAILYLRRSDESWAAEYGGPVRQTSSTAIGCLWAVVIVPVALGLISLLAIVSLLFMGNQISGILDEVDRGVPISSPLAPASPFAPAATSPSASTTAIDALLEEAAANPDDVDVLLALADAYYAAEDYTASGTWFDKVLAVDPGNEEARLARGAVHFNLGEFEQAKRVWLAFAAAHPDDQEVHYDLGFLYLNEEPPDWDGVQREWNRGRGHRSFHRACPSRQGAPRQPRGLLHASCGTHTVRSPTP